MGIAELLLLSVGLAMDAFAVSVCKGLAMQNFTFKRAVICGIWFGAFQSLMPTVGYFLGASFASYVTKYTPWIAFLLLCIIGGNMIREALSKKDEQLDDSLDVKTMFLLATATSIDALAVGVTFACVPVSILSNASPLVNLAVAVIIIGLVTFTISCVGVKIGGAFGARYEKKAEIAGGIVLIILGIKILLETIWR